MNDMKNFKNIKFLLARSWKINKSNCLFIVANNLFQAILPLINIVGLGMVINALVINESYNHVMTMIIIYLSINLGIAIIREVLQLFVINTARKVTNIAQFDFSKDSVNVNYHYAQDGTIMNFRKKAMSAYPGFYENHFGELIKYIAQFVGVISILSLLSSFFLLLIVITSVISIVLIFKTRRNEFDFQNDKVEEDRKLDYLYKVMTEYSFAKEVRINNAEYFVDSKYAGILKIQIQKLKVLYNKSFKINLASMFITIIQTALMYLYFSNQVFIQQITISEYTVLLGTTTLLTSLLLGFFDNIAHFGRVCDSVAFYDEYKNLVEKQSNIIKSNELKEKDVDFANAIIKFENVSFVYPNTDNLILKNINLEIKKGEKIGIVGLNGSGKTTFVKLLTRIYDPTEGRITINGVDIKDIPYQQYMRHISVVLQDFLLFAYSIKENIILDNEYDDEKLFSSIDKSGLNEKIKSLKNGFETSVYKTLDDEGVEFSGGEGQKLALARAIYKCSDIFILDEPTSALDPIAEYELFSKLNHISGNKTTIFISHRLSSTKFCDKIVVLSEGKIIEFGSHKELIDSNKLYATLFNAQAQYYRTKGIAINE